MWFFLIFIIYNVFCLMISRIVFIPHYFHSLNSIFFFSFNNSLWKYFLKYVTTFKKDLPQIKRNLLSIWFIFFKIQLMRKLFIHSLYVRKFYSFHLETVFHLYKTFMFVWNFHHHKKIKQDKNLFFFSSKKLIWDFNIQLTSCFFLIFP